MAGLVFNAAMPEPVEPADSLFTRIMQGLLCGQVVDDQAALASNASLANVVKYNSGSGLWELCRGTLALGPTDIVGIVEGVGAVSTVRIAGVHVDASLPAQTAYYCQADGTLGTAVTKVFMGYTTSPGRLCLPSLGGGSGDGGSRSPQNIAGYRFDPFANASTAQTRTRELYVVPTTAPYVINLLEVPHKDSPSTLRVEISGYLPAAVSNAQTTIPVSSLAGHAPGETVTIESEQMFVTAVNSAMVTSTITAAITSTTATSCTVANGALFVVGETIQIDSEMCYISGISTNTLTIIRGYKGTATATHAVNANVSIANQLVVTRGQNGTTAASHVAGTLLYVSSGMAEVSSAPDTNQFMPDYNSGGDGDANWNKGAIGFSADMAGAMVAVTYRGMGPLMESLIATPGISPYFCNFGDGSGGDFVSTANISLSGECLYDSFILREAHTVTVNNSSIPTVVIRARKFIIVEGKISGAAGGVIGATDAAVNISQWDAEVVGGTGGSNTAAGVAPSALVQATVVAGYTSPLTLCLGGGGAFAGDSSHGRGGAAVVLIAPLIVFSGTISSNGQPAAQYYPGGGAGWIVLAAKRLDDRGTISASAGSSVGNYYCGGAGVIKKLQLLGG